jgi:hypothetical protein
MVRDQVDRFYTSNVLETGAHPEEALLSDMLNV